MRFIDICYIYMDARIFYTLHMYIYIYIYICVYIYMYMYIQRFDFIWFDWLIYWLIDRFIDLSIDSLTDWLNQWLIKWMRYSSTLDLFFGGVCPDMDNWAHIWWPEHGNSGSGQAHLTTNLCSHMAPIQDMIEQESY